MTSGKPPDPQDLFEPRMPQVDVPADMAAVFSKARTEVAAGGPQRGLDQDQRCIGVLTPGRMVMFVPAPRPGSVSAGHVEMVRKLVPSDRPLNITAIGYTHLEALTKDLAKCIPLVSQLLGLAYIGHNVIVFEGHPTAFEEGVRGADALLVDSGMMPFLHEGWASAAFRVLRNGGRIFAQDRRTGNLMRVIASRDPKGWRYGEPDGEASYANCLLTTLAKGPGTPVQIGSGLPLPDLAGLTTDPKQLEWIGELPFKYEALDTDKVMAILLKVAGSSGVLKAQLATGAGQRQAVSFQLTATTGSSGRKQLQIVKSGTA